MNAPHDLSVVTRLQKESATAAAVHARTSYTFPRFVRVPGKRRPIPSGWEARQRNNVATVRA